jgi:ankyrin
MLYDIDTPPEGPATFTLFGEYRKSPAAPLYYAALCGFYDLVEHLIVKYPQDVNASGGCYIRPIVAALAGKYFRTAELLHQNGADLRIHGNSMRTPLHSAAYYGDLEVVQKLIEYDVDINALDADGVTPLYIASGGVYLKDRSVLRFLLEHGADVNARTKCGLTPLYHAAGYGILPAEVVRVLLEHGANVKAESNFGRTALQIAMRADVRKLLLEYGAK